MLRNVPLAAGAALAVLLWADSLLANPSTAQPDLPLEIRNSPISRQVYDPLVLAQRQAAGQLDRLEQTASSGDLSGGDVATAGDIAAANFWLQAGGMQLEQRGEAAGVDFQLRAVNYRTRLKKIIDQLRSLGYVPGDQIEQALRSLQASHQKRLPALEQQAAKGELEPVELELLRILADFARLEIWIENNAPYSRPFSQARDAIRPALAAQRQAQLQEELVAALAQEDPRHADLLARLAAALVDLKKSGNAPWNGASHTGPELIGLAFGEWRLAHQRSLRRRALEIAGRGDAKAAEAMTAIDAADLKFAGDLRAAMAQLIEADAARIQPPQAKALYQAYLAALSAVAIRTDRSAALAAWSPALDQLAAKDPALAAEAKAYATATSDLLRWRRRCATARGFQLQAQGYPQLVAELANKVRDRPNEPCLLKDQMPPDMMRLFGPAPTALRRLQAELISRPCTVPEVVGLGGGRAASRYRSRTYSRCELPLATRYLAELTGLKNVLLMGPKYSPPTLDAAAAVAAAEQDCFERVGGLVQQVTLEPLVTRFATLPDRATSLSPADRMPSEPLDEDLRSHVLVRVDLVPHWVQHECFTAVLVDPAPPPE